MLAVVVCYFEEVFPVPTFNSAGSAEIYSLLPVHWVGSPFLISIAWITASFTFRTFCPQSSLPFSFQIATMINPHLLILGVISSAFLFGIGVVSLFQNFIIHLHSWIISFFNLLVTPHILFCLPLKILLNLLGVEGTAVSVHTNVSSYAELVGVSSVSSVAGVVLSSLSVLLLSLFHFSLFAVYLCIIFFFLTTICWSCLNAVGSHYSPTTWSP